MIPIRSASLALCLLTGACISIDAAPLELCVEKHGIAITQGDGPEGCKPVATIATMRTGFYLFALIPIVPVRLTWCVEDLMEQAKALGADGVCHVRYEYMPASFFKLTALSLPDWSCYISMTGMAYKAHSD